MRSRTTRASLTSRARARTSARSSTC